MLKFYNFIRFRPIFFILFTIGVVLIPQNSDKSESTLVYATYGDIGDWDPSSFFSLEILTLGNVYETLVRYNPNSDNNVIEPCLAEEWSVSDDGLTWTFRLRKDVYFHDGTELTSESVKSSIERTIKLNKGGAYIWDPVKSIKLIDKHSLEIKTHFPAPVDLIASSQYAAYIYSMPTGIYAETWFNEGNASGTGPYQVRQWDRNHQVVIEKFNRYWKKWDTGQIERVIFKIVRESATQVQMILSGEADFVTLVPVEILEAMNKHKGIKISFIPSWKNSQFLINTKKEPTNNIFFRKALTHAWDYNSVIEDIYENSAETPSGILPKSIWGHSKLKLPEFDLVKAKKYLDASGISNDKLNIEIAYISTSTAYQYAAELFQNNLSKIGIKAELKPGSWGTIWSDAKTDNRAPNLISMTWWPTYPTPSDWLIGLFKTEEPTNFNLSKYSNSTYDGLIEEGVKLEASNRKDAIEKYTEAQEILVDDAVAIFFADLKERVIYRNDIENLLSNPAYSYIDIYNLRRKKKF